MRFLFILFTVSVISLSACEQPVTDKPAKNKPSHFVETAEARMSSEPLEFTGTGVLSAQREVKLITQVEGILTALPYYEGDRVKKGDVLARLDDALLRAELNRAKALHEKARQDLKRAKALYQQKLASEESLNAAQTALEVAKADESLLKTRLDYTSITAPFSGVITQRLLETGDVAERFTHILTLSDANSLTVEAQLSDLLVKHVAVNNPVQVSIDALGREHIPGRVVRIHPQLDQQTHQAKVEIQLDHIPDAARAGQFCRVLFHTNDASRLLVPFKALRRDESGEYVFVVAAENKIARKNVVSGVRIGEQVEVVRGIVAGDNVVTRGFLDLKPGKTVQVVNQPAKQEG